MSLRPEETDLVGDWIVTKNGLEGDAVEKRIDLLVTTHLQRIAISPESGAWEILYRDPADGRYWELTYPHSEMHGGGPKRLTNLAVSTVGTKYRLGL